MLYRLICLALCLLLGGTEQVKKPVSGMRLHRPGVWIGLDYFYANYEPPYHTRSRWVPMYARLQTERKVSAVCQSSGEIDCRPLSWQKMLGELKGLSLYEQARRVNDFVNEEKRIQEPLNEDNWLTPFEFFRAGGGDCEDFAIAKYELLRSAGVPEELMQIVTVQTTYSGSFHAVLLVRVGKEGMILDNLSPTFIPLRSVTVYNEMYSISEQGFWLNSEWYRLKR